jgi:hypothetical protein
MAELPNGQWIFFGNFPYEATPEQFQAYLLAAGIEVSLDRIKIKPQGVDGQCAALISLPASEVATLVWRATNNEPFGGRELRIMCPGSRRPVGT